MGGVPFYWSLLKKGYSLAQNIDAIFFAKDAPLKDEYKYLYASLFKNPEKYMQIVSTLGKKKLGMTRQEIIEKGKLTNSGALTKQLEELELCGFIRKYVEYGKKKKDSVYQLIDAFTLFYYHFMEKRPTDEHFWMNSVGTPKINTWQGLAFERVCMLHINQIKSNAKKRGDPQDQKDQFGTVRRKTDDKKNQRQKNIDLKSIADLTLILLMIFLLISDKFFISLFIFFLFCHHIISVSFIRFSI
jgi:hypothetical protein